MAELLVQKFEGHQLTDTMLKEAAKLFNENYGTWGKDPTTRTPLPPQGKLGERARSSAEGSRVKMTKDRLRAQCLPENTVCAYVRATVDDRLVGNAFACYWTLADRVVCWVTQLVVHVDYRKHGLATSLLTRLRQEGDDTIYGIMSSHPAACLAAAKAFTNGINAVATDFIRDNAKAVIEGSPVSYVQKAELRGNLFDPQDISGAVSCVDTVFFVDHTEPLE
ncbi:MAG: hypothetical protein Q9190_004118, partial [Brigantiaea leucoxantha]